jgi:hypothetical protein
MVQILIGILGDAVWWDLPKMVFICLIQSSLQVKVNPRCVWELTALIGSPQNMKGGITVGISLVEWLTQVAGLHMWE